MICLVRLDGGEAPEGSGGVGPRDLLHVEKAGFSKARLAKRKASTTTGRQVVEMDKYRQVVGIEETEDREGWVGQRQVIYRVHQLARGPWGRLAARGGLGRHASRCRGA